MLEKPSTCQRCGQRILWQKLNGRNVAFNAKHYGDEFRQTEVIHYKVCPYFVKKREQNSCPACLCERANDIDLIHRIKIDKPVCKHHVARGWFSVSKWGNTKVYPTNDFHALRKTLARREKKEEKLSTKLKNTGEFRSMDKFVFSYARD